MTAIAQDAGSVASVAEALRHLALDEGVKAAVLAQPAIYAPLLRAAQRFIGGEELEDCVRCARQANASGHAVTIDFMGESARDPSIVAAATDEFVRVSQEISRAGLDATISLDLSHIGLLIDAELCFASAMAIANAVPGQGVEIMISAEGVDRTDDVLAMYRRLAATGASFGITLQAYLKRTPDDLASVLESSGKIRIVKGAFSAPPKVALQRGPDLNAAYLALVAQVQAAGRLVSVASHDVAIIQRVVEAGTLDLTEFEMLRGVEAAQLGVLRDRGLRTRQYLPYGYEWYLYLCNRLAEHPPNVFDAIVALSRETASLGAHVVV